MTDKEKTIKELKEALDSLDITNKYRLNLIRAIEYLQEEPVSKDRKEAILNKAHELAKKAETISGKFPKSTLIAVAVDMAEWCYAHPIEEPVSEGICNQCEAHNDKDKCDKLVFGHKCPIVTTSEDLEEASEEYTGKVLERTNMLIGNQPVGEEIEAAFKAGVQWQKEQFEKNRLKHCNSITNEQAELEQGFIDQHIDKYNRMPTFLDAIEYGMRLQKQQLMAKAIDGIARPDDNEIWCNLTSSNLKDGDKVKVIVIKEE